MRSTMQDSALTIGSILKHGTSVQADSEVVTATADGTRSMTYAELGKRVAQLANALRSLGIDGDQRVGTFQWNNAEHLQAYLAVPSMGAVLHTLNIRLFPEQLVYIANHAEDQVLIVDDSLVGLLAPHLPEMKTVQHVLVAGPEAASADLDSLRSSGKEVLLYDELLDEQSDEFDWPEIDERTRRPCATPAAPPATPRASSTATDRRGCTRRRSAPATPARSSFHDRVLPIVPMFHANAWGLAYAAIMSGASLCMPDRWLQAEPLCRFMNETSHAVRCRADGVERRARLPGQEPREEARVPGADPVRRLRRTRLAAEGAPGPPRHRDPAGMGDDRDLARGLRGHASRGRRG